MKIQYLGFLPVIIVGIPFFQWVFMPLKLDFSDSWVGVKIAFRIVIITIFVIGGLLWAIT